MDHHCHARGCKVSAPPNMLMCGPHWFSVPKSLRDRVWATYRAGQEIDKRPSEEWHAAADAAIEAVALSEALKELFPRRVGLWLRSPHEQLVGKTPLDAIVAGEAKRVWKIVDALRGGSR